MPTASPSFNAPGYFPPSYFAGLGGQPAPEVAPPIAIPGSGYFAPTYFAPSYFGGLGGQPKPAAPYVPPVAFKLALFNFLRDATPVTSLLSGPPEPLRLSSETSRPALRYRVGARIPQFCLDGPTGVATATVEFEASSFFYDDVEDIILAVNQLFLAFRGDMAGCPVLSALARSDDDDYASGEDSSDDGIYSDAILIDFTYRTS